VEKPRCGFSSTCGGGGDGGEISPEFNLSPSKWEKLSLAYTFDSFCDDISQQEVRTAITDALARWTNVTPLLFNEVPTGRAADIRIKWAKGDHGDGYLFDGAGRVLAHAFCPPPYGGTNAGSLHFDEDEGWTVEYAMRVAIHEFGHALGLGHSDERDSIMFPYLGPRTALHQDDINGIQSLYGSCTNGWFNYELSPPASIQTGSGIATASPTPATMEVWWIAPSGSVQEASWSESRRWQRAELAEAGRAVRRGIVGVSRRDYHLDVWSALPALSMASTCLAALPGAHPDCNCRQRGARHQPCRRLPHPDVNGSLVSWTGRFHPRRKLLR
jgi:hypothetical protein